MLVERPESTVFVLFASQLSNRDRQAADRGVTYLKAIGPAAESYVWPVLRSTDRNERERACEVLAVIGTSQSLPHLERLSDDPATSSQAQSAMLRIRNANRQPTENTPITSGEPITPSE